MCGVSLSGRPNSVLINGRLGKKKESYNNYREFMLGQKHHELVELRDLPTFQQTYLLAFTKNNPT